MQTSLEQQTELERIESIANDLYGTRAVRLEDEPQYMLYLLLSSNDKRLLFRDSVPPIDQLLTVEYAEAARMLHRIVTSSRLRGLIKFRVCSAVEFFLRERCGQPIADDQKFKFNLFEGLDT